MLTPKNIILNSLTSKLEGTGVIKIIAIFNVDCTEHNVIVKYENGTSDSLELDKKELNTVKMLMIKRIVRAWKKSYEEIPDKIIIQIDIESEKLDTYIEDITGKVLLFN